jgi:polyhydroxyalkanoate synthesis regulator phasin
MAAANSSGRSRKSSGRRKTSTDRQAKTGSAGRGSAASAAGRGSRKSPRGSSASRGGSATRAAQAAVRQSRSGAAGGRADGLSGLAEQLANRILKPLGLVVLSRDRIAEALEEAVEQGRVTRSDAERLVAELVARGRQETEELLSDLDRTLGAGRQQLDLATRRARRATPDRLIRGADRARRSIGVGPAFPIIGYDDLTVAQVQSRLSHLSDPDLRKVRDYERRHGNRKSLLSAIEKALG